MVGGDPYAPRGQRLPGARRGAGRALLSHLRLRNARSPASAPIPARLIATRTRGSASGMTGTPLGALGAAAPPVVSPAGAASENGGGGSSGSGGGPGSNGGNSGGSGGGM